MDFKNNIRLGVSVDPLSSVETKVNEIVEKLSNKKITLDISFKDSSVADQLKTLTKLVDDFKEKFDLEKLPDEDRSHFQTMGGFLTSYFGYIPKVAEKCEWNGFTFEVVDMDRARIDKILMTREEQPTADEKDTSAKADGNKK